MTWDPSLGAPKQRDWALNPFQPLETPYRARRAAGAGVVAAVLLCFVHGLYALRFAFDHRPVRTLVSDDARVLLAISLFGVAASAALGFGLRARPRIWMAAVIFGWSVLETQRWLTASLYGHVAGGFLPVGMVVASFLSLRGTLAAARLANRLRDAGSQSNPAP